MFNNLEYFVVEGIGLVLAGLIQGVTGFGIGLVAVAFLSIYHPPFVVIPSLVGVYIFTSVVLLWEHREFFNRKILEDNLLITFPSLSLALIGMIGGSFLLRTISTQYVTLVLGIFIVIFSFYNFFQSALNKKFVSISGLSNKNRKQEKILCYSASTTAGVLEGLLGLGGPPVALYLVYKRLDSRIFITAISSFFLWVNPLRLINYIILGLVDFEVIKLTLFIFIFVAIGLLLGILLRKMLINERKFRVLTVALLFMIGMNLILKSFSMMK